MASHSPVGLDPEEDANALDQGGSYVEGWQGITRLMDSGASWSGHERNCAYLNLGDRRFVDVSAAAGLDHVQDGRAAAQLDWDGDGDLDLWLKSRNGRQLRLLENTRAGAEDFVALRLRGTSCNRDAIGARVELQAGGERYVQELRCGEGYLAQSTRELVFGLGGADEVDGVLVHWPGGEAEAFEGVAPGARLRLIQGEGVAVPLEARSIVRAPGGEATLPELPSSSRVVLRTPLPLPPQFLEDHFDLSAPRARLVNLWATWCAPCVGELQELAQHSDELAYVGLEVVPLCLDGADQPGSSAELFEQSVAPHMKPEAPFATRDLSETERTSFELLLEHLIAKRGATPVPASLLVDKNGMVEVLYLGPVDVATLIEDAASYGMQPQQVPVRSSYPGRWFYGMPRNFEALSRAFRAAGQSSYATYYAALHQMSRRRAQ